MRILLFGGFLGSGKTTTMLRVAKYLDDTCQHKIAIIENEIGAAGIDDKLFSESGLQVKRLFGGCVCCQISSDLLSAIQEIHDTIAPDWLMIEMTGLAFPDKTARQIKKLSNLYSTFKTITLIDHARWSELKSVLRPVILGQLEGSDLIIVNKTDLAQHGVQQIIEDLREMDIRAKTVITSAAKEIPADVIEEMIGI